MNVRKEKFLEAFGEHLKELRRHASLSQSHLAALADVPKSQVSRIENGKVNPTISTLLNLATALRIDVKDLVDFKYP